MSDFQPTHEAHLEDETHRPVRALCRSHMTGFVIVFDEQGEVLVIHRERLKDLPPVPNSQEGP